MMEKRWFIEGEEYLKDTVSDSELKKVIADFLEMGHVENIFEMFKREPLYYDWVGDILNDERFNVRLGISVLFEELKERHPHELSLAIPSLERELENEQVFVRGEAVSVLGIIGSPDAVAVIKKALHDTSPQVVDVARDILEELA